MLADVGKQISALNLAYKRSCNVAYLEGSDGQSHHLGPLKVPWEALESFKFRT